MPHIGSDGLAENDRIRENIILQHLNHVSNKKNMVERQTLLFVVNKAMGAR